MLLFSFPHLISAYSPLNPVVKHHQPSLNRACTSWQWLSIWRYLQPPKRQSFGQVWWVSLDWANRGGDAHPKGGQHHFMSRACRLNKRVKELGTSIRKLFLDFSFHVTRCLKPLLPRLLHSAGLWSQTVSQNKHFLPYVVSVQYFVTSYSKQWGASSFLLP